MLPSFEILLGVIVIIVLAIGPKFLGFKRRRYIFKDDKSVARLPSEGK
jgi:hypothetical protein